ncbi:metallophosphoesterase family protein [Oryzomonas rubra]|uniref:Metallophosphoesterase n=1 Tax=Oryzomonas rubra TaxID=2509454 RepID=A0A5A9XHK7_9BACT|nr:metallophosphoesterase [Oryzomonas rubra]KAA0892304.1 metallophosphoesterase [Oryzomonas rubra]
MSQNDDKNDGLEPGATKGIDRREFIKRTAIGAGAVAATMVTGGCGGSSSASSVPPVAAAVGTKSPTAWKFAVMADTQWLAADDGKNPNTSAIGLITQLNQQFIAQGVKFAVQVGDLADQAYGASTEAGYATTALVCEDTRAVFAQSLYNNGIGFFVCRGNHDDTAATAAEFANIFPQTQNGKMNATPTATFTAVSGAPYPDTANQPLPAQSGSSFTIGSNFSTIGSPSNNLKGLSYGFDYNNARFVFIDQFTPNAVDATGVDGNGSAYSMNTTAKLQQTWITNTLAGKPTGGHAFVFSHKGLITQQHIDVLFGACPADADFAAAANTTTGAAAKTYVGSTGLNAFIRSMSSNSARLYFCGHDHIHNRSVVKTTDTGSAAQVTHVLCQSVSSKFYTPNENDTFGNSNVPAATSNDAFFCGGKRQTQLSQEVYAVGYYIVTVDGATVSVDYYSAPAYPSYGSPTENLITTTPTLNFTKRETFGYSLNGKQFVLGNGDSFTTVADTGPSGTTVAILSGANNNPNSDLSGRKFYNDVNTGWYTKTSSTVSDILALWGMGHTLGSDQTDTFTLSLSYSSGSPVLGTPDGNGNWINAVDQNLGGAKKFVQGPWKSGYALGTYGIDTATKTVWAVLNYNSYFAAVAGI